MAHSLTTIGRHLECAIQVEIGRTGVSSNRKDAISSISAQSHYMPESYERVLVGWQCANVKGRVELKIDKTQSKDL